MTRRLKIFTRPRNVLIYSAIPLKSSDTGCVEYGTVRSERLMPEFTLIHARPTTKAGVHVVSFLVVKCLRVGLSTPATWCPEFALRTCAPIVVWISEQDSPTWRTSWYIGSAGIHSFLPLASFAACLPRRSSIIFHCGLALSIGGTWGRTIDEFLDNANFM